MTKKLIFIKLGGSLISDKTKVNKPRLSAIKKVCKDIKKLLQKNRSLSVVIFTGAGGYGHPVAAKYENNLEKGLPLIKKAVKEINRIVVDSLKKAGLNAQQVEPDKITEYRDGKMVTLLSRYVVSLLEKNTIPVFHADLVHDKKLGLSILSMDKFLVDSAIYLKREGYKFEKAVFIGAMPGVVDGKGKLINKISKRTMKKISGVFQKNKTIDVSGGMKYKVDQCLRLADDRIKSQITNDLFTKGTVVIA